MAKMKGRAYNDSMGESHTMDKQEELDEGEDYYHNKKVMRGHAPDSRFDEGSTDTVPRIVRPAEHVKPKFSGYLGKSGRGPNLNAGHIKTSTPAKENYQPAKVKGHR